MNKKTLLFIFLALVVVFVYPSSRSAGVDCIAGCVMSKGEPLPYSVIHGSGIVGGGSSEFFIGRLVLDILIWFGVALLVTKGISFLKSKF